MRIKGCISLSMVWLAMACTAFPQLDDKITSDATKKPYPNLIPVEAIRIQAPEPRITPDTGTDLQSRVEALKRRADAIRGPVIDAATRQRMEAGVSR